MAALVRRYAKHTEDFHRELTLPQEDRHKVTSAPWSGGYRWFRSPNVTPIEYYRRPSIDVTKPTKRTG
jgi:hypothetical protein